MLLNWNRLIATGFAELHIKPFLIGGVLLGGVLFGVGMAVLGYCPGTGVAACGEGKPDAMVGVLGMFAGAFAFVFLWPTLRPIINGLGDLGKITFPIATNAARESHYARRQLHVPRSWHIATD